MQFVYKKFFHIINRHPFWMLGAGIIIYIVVFVSLSFWKYDNFLYNALDLGIYAQVFESFRNGNYWYSSIQQSSYLGDHFEPFILALLPFYLLIPHPKTLLVLQTIFLALPAIPIFFIARTVFKNQVLSIKYQELLPLGIAFFYILNPLVHNINLFEFHLLPFSLIFLFTASYFYIKKNQGSEIKDYGFFIIFCFLSVLVREDIPLIVFMFGVLALFEGRRWYWVIGPMILATWWFILSMGIISAFNIEGSYKFLIYYSWIFNASPSQFLLNFFWQTDNWVMVFGFLLVFLFLPLFKTRFLLLALAPFLQFALIGGGSGGVVWVIHYAAYFLPALFLASIFGIKRLINLNFQEYFKNRPYDFVFKDKGLLITIFSLATIGLIVIFGPAGNCIPYIKIDGKRRVAKEETWVQKSINDMIPPDSSAVLSSSYLPAQWANNPSALFWLFKGFKQFSSQTYIPSYSTEYAFIDSEDLFGFIFSLREYENGDNRVRNFLKERKFFVQNYLDRFILFSKKPTENFLYKILDTLPKSSSIIKSDQKVDKSDHLALTAYTPPEFSEINLSSSDNKFSTVSFSLFWKKLKDTDKIYVVNIVLRDKRGKVAMNKKYPLGYGLYPATDWEMGKIVQTNHRVLLSDNLKGEYGIYMKLTDATDGGFALDQIRSDAVLIPDRPISEEIFLGSASIY